jgi:nickel transport system substrate-binding protein
LKKAVGTGPWKLVTSKLGEPDLFKWNENHWCRQPSLQGIDVKVISDPNNCVVALETGVIDLIYGDDQISPDLFQRFRSNPDFTTGLSSPLATRTVALNSDKGPTTELAVRQVIQHAVNKEQKTEGFHLTFNNTWGPPYKPQAYLNSMRTPSYADNQAQAGLSMKSDLDDAIGKVLKPVDEDRWRKLYH